VRLLLIPENTGGKPARSHSAPARVASSSAQVQLAHEVLTDIELGDSRGYESDGETTVPDTTTTTRTATSAQVVPKTEISELTVGQFGRLSNAIIWRILSLLDAVDLCQLSRTSVQFYKLATNEFLWERLYIRTFRKNNLKVDKNLWHEQERYGGYRALYGTKLCEEQLQRTLKSLQNGEPPRAVDWLCKPLVSVQNFFSSPDVKIIMLGLNGTGKTSILYRLIRNEKVRTAHTIGFNHETLEHNGYNFDIWDLEYKPQDTLEFWKVHFTRAKGIIFVVDASSPETLSKAKSTLSSFISEPDLSNLPLLVFLNKRDVVDSMNALQVLVGLNLHHLCNKCGWHIQPCSTLLNDNSLLEGLDWFCETFQSQDVQRLKTKMSQP